MSELLRCEQCGTAFEHDPESYSASCPDCDRRYHPRTGCC